MNNYNFDVYNIIAAILAIVGLIWLIYTLWINLKIGRIRSWPKTNAVIINSIIEPANNAAGNIYLDPTNIIAANNNARYMPRVFYKYTVNGKEYQSNNLVYAGSRSYTATEVKVMLDGLSPGSTVPVFYDSNQPSEAYIYNGKSSYTGIISGIILLLLAGYIMYYRNSNTSLGRGTSKTKANLSDYLGSDASVWPRGLWY